MSEAGFDTKQININTTELLNITPELLAGFENRDDIRKQLPDLAVFKTQYPEESEYANKRWIVLDGKVLVIFEDIYLEAGLRHVKATLLDCELRDNVRSPGR